MIESDAVQPEPDEAPELTDRDFAQAISFKDLLARHRISGSEPANGEARSIIVFDMAADVVRGIEASGPDDGFRVEAPLRDALAQGGV